MQDQMLIQSKYDEIGYIYATSEPKYDNGILHYQLEEGQTVEMGTLSIVGNHQTKKHVLIREFENLGLRNNFGIHLKNLNSLGKNDDTYKSSPQVELQSLLELKSESSV